MLDGEFDVLVVGGGPGGLYGVHRFRSQGLSVLGVEAAPDLGGVWYHNSYPGARVDVDSVDYCYYFSQDVWDRWNWSERNAGQPELSSYLNFVAEHHRIRDRYLFGTRMTGAQWDPTRRAYTVELGQTGTITARFIVMATGNLSTARAPAFPGLETFRGEVVTTSHWPKDGLDLDGKRIGVIGTGSSGVQVIPMLARQARQLYVFQRTAHYAVPARNHPIGPEIQREIARNLAGERETLLTTTGARISRPTRPLTSFAPAERHELLERQWQRGGQAMNFLFTDQGTVRSSNDAVADFVRAKIRRRVKDPALAEMLCPKYPIGTRRLALETGYYETFNQDHTTLVDIRREPIREFTESGIRTVERDIDLDVVVLALGFNAFTGAIDEAGIRNEHGRSPTDGWARGPRTLLGLMTAGFPNLFFPTGPGSPSVLGNMILQNEFHMDWIGDCIEHLAAHSFTLVEPSLEAEAEWTDHVSDLASNLLRLQEDNYMVHINRDDGTRYFIPYIGGMGRYVEHARRTAADGYTGFVMT